MSQRVVIAIEVFNKVVDYIQSRPYVEVANIIEEIRNTAQLVDDSKVSEAKVSKDTEEEASDE